uniref:DOMON domain-containing protein n=1 Tax=Amphimedon queenslandica TaxID=400682 RepID=A0A1X7SXT8_AMPQE
MKCFIVWISLKNSVTVTWTAPATAGMLEIRYTVVVRNDGSSIFYANMNAGDFRPGSTEICPMTDKSSDATYPFRVGSPGDDYYFAARFNSDNSSFIDMQLEGSADGWIAVGFTGTRDMVQQSV